jgi:predicted small secreted protein
MLKCAILVTALLLSACGTVGGAVSGLGDDVKRVGEATGSLVNKGGQWIKSQ